MIETAFVSPVFFEKIETINNEDLKKFTYELKNKTTGRIASNLGGWQSESIEEPLAELKDLVQEITTRCNQFHVDLGIKSSYVHAITNMWINVNKTGSMNRPHCHPGSTFSGVYYVSCKLDSGRIVFTNPNAYFCNEGHIETYTPVTSAMYFQRPEESKIIIFPSWMSHYVEPNENSEDRISISFNTSIYREDLLDQ